MDFPTYKVTERTYRYGVRIPDSNFFDYLVSTYDLIVDKDGKISPPLRYFTNYEDRLFPPRDRVVCRDRIVPESDLFELRMESRQKTRITESL